MDIKSTLKRIIHQKAPDANIPTVDWLLANRKYSAELPSRNDPVSTLYRLYESFVLDDNAQLRSEIEYFWNRPDWPVSSIPDPQDPHPTRYAILAVLTCWLAKAFNHLITHGTLRRTAEHITPEELKELQAQEPKALEEPPAWAAEVPALPYPLYIPRADGEKVKDEDASPEMMKKNIMAFRQNILF